MRKFMKKIIRKYGKELCMIAAVAAPAACDFCRIAFHEPAEPEGLAEFAKQHSRDKVKRQKS